nr:hypothetical protein [Paenibacillus sp.]
MSMEDLLKELKGENAPQEDPNFVSLEQLFNEKFLRGHSSFESFEAFLAKGNFQARTHEEIKNIEGELFDRYIARETDFRDWKQMLEAAKKEHEASKGKPS